VDAGVEEVRGPFTLPSALSANPNPFAGSTTISCAVPLESRSELRLYDAAGNLVRTLSASGSRILSGSGLKPGVYVLRAGEQSTRLVKVTH
jgi:hypothetical protein